jgi:hypothetical protein
LLAFSDDHFLGDRAESHGGPGSPSKLFERLS